MPQFDIVFSAPAEFKRQYDMYHEYRRVTEYTLDPWNSWIVYEICGECSYLHEKFKITNLKAKKIMEDKHIKPKLLEEGYWSCQSAAIMFYPCIFDINNLVYHPPTSKASLNK